MKEHYWKFRKNSNYSKNEEREQINQQSDSLHYK